ncbi:MAG: hypothetical protein E7602_06980 [Ruminococcaceae bacterium]|nr:hypothetical protein [Oscillospiraceae bacterium]
MKAKRSIVIAFLLVAVMVLGVGFAAVSTVLDITGKADVNPDSAFKQDIYFDSATANDAGNTAAVNVNDDNKASFTANNLSGKGDSASFTYVIKNDGDLDATISVTACAVSVGDTSIFNIETDWDAAQPLAAGGDATITVTVSLKETPAESVSGSFIVELKAEAVNA